MVIGTADNAKSTYYIDAKMAQIYFIDGQALGPEYFGYTDPLTNTWRPKKYTNTTESLQPITTAPTLSNGALIIKAKGNSIGGLLGLTLFLGHLVDTLYVELFNCSKIVVDISKDSNFLIR